MGELIRLFNHNEGGEDIKKAGVVKARPGSPNLYVDFYYFGERVTLSTGYPNTPENRIEIEDFLRDVIEKRDAGTLEFGREFPKAPEHLRVRFAKLEGRGSTKDPDVLTFGAFTTAWLNKVLDKDPSHTKRHDYRKILEWMVLPFFANLTFFEINGVCLKLFVTQLVHKKGRAAGTP